MTQDQQHPPMSWLNREDLEEQEMQRLSPWASCSRQAGGRRKPEAEDPLRTAFVRDRDRIIHSAAFRRLQHKTQVFAAHEGDYFRSRMTHSLEVAQMGRGAAIALRLNPDLAEAVALGHDLGHPPFGHVGEEALNELLATEGGFRHNAQGLRIVDYLEDRQGDGLGLNLNLITRRCLLKGRVPEGFPLSPDLLPKVPPPPEAHVVDLCDRIAYLCHDLDDALRAGLVQKDEAAELALWQSARQRLQQPISQRVLSEMVAVLFQDLVQASATALPRIRHSDAVVVQIQELLAFLRQRFYRSPRILKDMHAGQDKLRASFQYLVDNPSAIPQHFRDRLANDSLRRVVCDYLAGMTDRFLLTSKS